MSLKIILGPKSEGKSKYIYDLVNNDSKEFKDVLLFVPSQRRVAEENEYMEYLNLDGILNLKITTISEYIKKMISITNIHVGDTYLSNIDRKVLVSKLSKDNKFAFEKYSKVLDKEGFITELENYIEIFRNMGLGSIDISKVLENIDTSDNTKKKLFEILNIYNVYVDTITKKGFCDDTSYIDIYKAKVNDLPQKIYFDGYNNFKEVEYDIIKMYLQSGKDVTIAITTDATSIADISALNTSEIFEVSNETYMKLVKISQQLKIDIEEIFVEYSNSKAKDLQALCQNTFSYENEEKIDAQNINIYQVNNEKSEIYSVAENIVESIKNGANFKESIICVTDITKYENIIKKVFLEYKIPYYIDKTESIKNNIFVRYFLSFINLIYKTDVSSIIKLLKLGLNNIDDNEISIIENYCLEFNIRNFNNKFVYNSKSMYDLEKLNKIREDIVKLFNFSDFDIDAANSKYYLQYIYGKLQNMGVIDKYINIIENLVDDPTQKDIFIQVISKVNEAIDSIYKIYQDENISYVEFLKLCDIVISTQNINTIPEVENQVLILDINKSKTTSKKFVYVLGANEEEFPIMPKEDYIFSDQELENIQKSFIKFKESTDSRYNMGLYNIYEVFNIPTEKITFYIKSSNLQGKTLNKSRVIDDILETINVKIQGKVVDEKYEFPTNENLLVSLNDVELSIKRKVAIYEYLSGNEIFYDVLNYKKNDGNLKKDTLDLLYKEKINSSVSRLETFKKCPFAYSMKYLLNIKKREKFEVSSIDIGNFMHEVIEEFSRFLFSETITWASLTCDEEFEKIEYVIDDIINNKIDKILQKQKESVRYSILKQRLITTVKSIIKIIAKSFSQSNFIPYGYEIEFKDGALFAPIVVKIGDKTVELIGKIDRVDVLKNQDEMYVRVVDYKSSDRNLDIDSIKEGISIQLLVYLSAFIENMNKKEELKILPAAMTYFTISNKLIDLDKVFSEDEIKQKIISQFRLKGIFLNDIEVLNKMDNKFEDKQRLIDVSKTSLTRCSKKILDEKDFSALCDQAKSILKDILDELLSGVVSISPNSKADPCKFCEYENICRKNIKI